MRYGIHFKTALSTVIFLGIFIFSGCKKEYPDPLVDYLPQDFKDWMFFKEGTYWVYQDSVSGALDSTVVTRTESEIIKINEDGGKAKEGERILKKSEVLAYYTYSIATGKEYKFMSADRCPALPNYQTDQCLLIVKLRKVGDVYKSGAHLLFYNMPERYYLTGVFLNNKYDSLQIGNQYYKDVVVNWHPASSNEGGVESWYYLAKGIGIVQIRERNKGQLTTQKLVRYHVQQ